MSKIFVIHVGNMNNKGTQALLKSDISLIREVLKGVTFSISTTDVEGVKRLLSLGAHEVFLPMVDIPYERADLLAKKLDFPRNSIKYKAFALENLFLMFVQMALSAFSSVLFKAGLRPFYRRSLLESLKNSDLVVSYSDENFKEDATLLPLNLYWILTWWTLLLSRTWDVLIAKFLGKNVVMFPNSVGSFRTIVGRTLARLALNRCDHILIREPRSFNVVASLGIRTPKTLVADTALLFKASTSSSLSNTHKPIMGVAVGVYSHSVTRKQRCKFIESVAEALDVVVRRHGFHAIFLPHYVTGFQFDDLEISKQVMERMETRSQTSLIGTSNVEEYKSLLSQMDIVLSSKMHPCVLAASAFVPAVCIAYDDKQVAFFEQLDLSDCVLPFQRVTSKNLASKINTQWDKRDETKAKLKKHVPPMQAKIRTAVKQILTVYMMKKTSEDERVN